MNAFARRSHLRSLLALCLFGGAWLAAPALARSTPAPASLPGLIAFANLDFGIAIVEPGNANSIRVIYPAEWVFDPSWSPDGRTLAFTEGWKDDLTYASIVLTDRDGRVIDKPLKKERIGAIDWSPDGNKIAYQCQLKATTTDPWEICVLDVASGKHRMLTDPNDEYRLGTDNGGGIITTLSWSPDGEEIAYDALHDVPCDPGVEPPCTSTDIVIADAVTGASSLLTNHGALFPEFSPDGTKLVYTDSNSTSGEPTGIVVMGAGGGSRREVVSLGHTQLPTGFGTVYNTPTWSPDGAKILFGSPTDGANNGNVDLFIVDAAGGKLTRTTNTPDDDRDASWAPPIPACTIEGTPKADVLKGTAAGDVICGNGGDDTIFGRGGDDKIVGGAGDDKLYGDGGNDEIRGEDGDDLIVGGTGKDSMKGGPGKDRLRAKDGVANEEVDGGPGVDDCESDAADKPKGCP